MGELDELRNLKADLERRGNRKKVFWSIVVAGGVFWFIGTVVSRIPQPQQSGVLPSVNYGTGLCPNAFESAADKSGRDDITHFSLVLGSGCWGGWVVLPKWWGHWYYELDSLNSWVAFWPDGERAQQPRNPVVKLNVCEYCSTFRLQGKGTITFYTNVRKAPRKPNGELDMNR